LADPGKTGERVLQVDDGVVGKKRLGEPIVVGIEAFDQQDVGADFLYIDALRSHRLRELRQCAVDRVLHQRERGIQVGSNCERDRQCVAAVAAAGGLYVDGIFDAVYCLLDGNSDRICNGLGVCSGVGTSDLDGRGHDARVLCDWQTVQAHRAEQNRYDCDYVGEDRALDEEL